MEEVEGIAQKIEEVEAIVDLEKSKVEEEPPNENERSNNREENTNNDTSIEVPAANILTTDKSELAILYEDVVNPNMPPISISGTKRVPCAIGECEEFCSVTDDICQQCPESERCYQYCSLHISHESHSNQTSSKRRGRASDVPAGGQQQETLPIRELFSATTIVPAAISEVSTVVQSAVDAPIIDLSDDISPSSVNLVSDGKGYFPLREYEELKPRLDNNIWEEKDQLKSTHSILYAKVDKYKLGDRPFYRAFSDNGSQVKLNFGDIITDSTEGNGIPHIFVGARLFEERNTVLLFFMKYWELVNACKASSTTVDSAIVNHLWMLDFYGKKGEFLSKFCKEDELYVRVRTIKCSVLQLAIIKQVDAVLKHDITKLYVGDLESAFLVVKSHNSGCDDDAVDVGDDDDDLPKNNSNSSQLTRVPSSRIKNIVTSKLLTEKFKTSSDGGKGKLLERTNKKSSDSLATCVSSSGKKQNSSGSDSINSAKDLATYTNTDFNRMNKPALTQIAIPLGLYSGRDLEMMSKKDIIEYLQRQRSLHDKSASSKRTSSSSSGSAQDLPGKYPRHSEYNRSPVHRTTSAFGRKDEHPSSPVRRTTSLGRKDEQPITRQQHRDESSIINLTTNSSSTILPVTVPSTNDNSQNERLVSQLISLTTALTSANASIIQTTTKVGEETKHRLVEAEELIKQKEIEHQETYRRMLVAETKFSMLNDFSAKEKTNREEEREYISKVQNQCQNTPQLNLLERVVMKDAAKAAPTPTNTFPEASVSTVSSSPLTTATPTIQQPILTNQQPPQQQKTYRDTFSSPALLQNQTLVDFQQQPLQAITSTSQLQPQHRFETHNQSNAQVLPPHLNNQTWQYTKQQDLYYQVQQEQNSCIPEQHFGQYHQPPSHKQYQQQSPRQHYQQTQQQSHQNQQQNYQQLTQQYQQSQQQSCSQQYQPQSQQQYHQQQQCQQSQQYQQEASEYHQQQPQKHQHILQQYQLQQNNRRAQQFIVRPSEDVRPSCYCNVPQIRDGGKFCGSCGGIVTIKLACCGIVSSGSFCTNCGTPKGFN